jgi:hypothetical protein
MKQPLFIGKQGRSAEPKDPVFIFATANAAALKETSTDRLTPTHQRSARQPIPPQTD